MFKLLLLAFEGVKQMGEANRECCSASAPLSELRLASLPPCISENETALEVHDSFFAIACSVM